MNKPKLLAIAAALFAIVVSVGAAWAHGGDTNFIHACVNKDTKAVRIVGAGSACKSSEKALHWPAADGTVLMARMNLIPSTFDQQLTFGAPSGTSIANVNEASVSMISPDATVKATDLVVSLTVQVNNNSARRFTLRVNGADTLLSCTMGSFGTSCTSNAVVSIPPMSLLSIQSDRPAEFNAEATEARITLRLIQ